MMSTVDVEPHPDRVANLLGALVVGLNDAVGSAMARAAGLDATGVSALLLVQAHPGLSITELAAGLDLTHSGAVRTLERLVDRDLVRRAAGPDRRTRGLYLTGAGEDVAQEALAARRRVLGGALGASAASGQEAFVRALEQVLAALPGTRADAWRICRTCEHAVCRGPACPVGHAVTLAETRAPRSRPSSTEES
jgi:DNA-binding MarR family transcriptional regulator